MGGQSIFSGPAQARSDAESRPTLAYALVTVSCAGIGLACLATAFGSGPVEIARRLATPRVQAADLPLPPVFTRIAPQEAAQSDALATPARKAPVLAAASATSMRKAEASPPAAPPGTAAVGKPRGSAAAPARMETSVAGLEKDARKRRSAPSEYP
jgi:hypothetical protein